MKFGLVLHFLVAFIRSSNTNFTSNGSLLFRKYSDQDSEEPYFTRFNGAIDPDIVNSLTLGPRGVLVLMDQTFRQRLTHSFREKIPSRAAGVFGPAGFGYFVCTNFRASKLSAATVFSEVGKVTRVFMRFSSGASQLGSPDLNRGQFKIAFRMFSDEGNWDVLTTSSPVFALRDPILFPDLYHSEAPDPRTNLDRVESYMDFLSQRPETLHQSLFQASDMGLPQGWRKTNGYSANTFKFVNKEGVYNYVRFILRSQQGEAYFDDEEAAIIRGTDPEWATRDMYSAIETGDFPAWNLEAQILEPERIDYLGFNAFDPTKIWDVKEIPPVALGKIVLNQKINNYFSQAEQVAMNPGNLIPGIQLSLDKVLIARTFVYSDAQNYRLGPNAHYLNINRPKVTYNNPTVRDGRCADELNGGSDPNYYPSSLGATQDKPSKEAVPIVLGSEELKRWDIGDDGNYSQVNTTYFSFGNPERQRISQRLAESLAACSEIVRERFLGELKKVNFEFLDRTRKALTKALAERRLRPAPSYD